MRHLLIKKDRQSGLKTHLSPLLLLPLHQKSTSPTEKTHASITHSYVTVTVALSVYIHYSQHTYEATPSLLNLPPHTTTY